MGFDYQSLASGQFQMPDGWKLTSIQEVAKVNEKTITPKIAPSHIRYIDIASVDKGKLLDIQEIPFKKAPSRARRVVRDNDFLISTVRPNLEHYLFVKEPEPNTIASTGFAVVSAKAVDPRFLYYYVTSKPFTAYLTQIAESHTSAYPAFNPDVIEQAELILPKDDEQRAIAHILGSLDDKIELNHRMNETLEAMARALFKSWFVDFDPVRAKAEGRPTGLPDDIAAFFPDSFEDSELGEIPKGWEVRRLSEISRKPQYGYTASANNEVVGPKFLRIKDINKFDWIDWATVPYCKIEERNIEKYSLQTGDIVIARMADPGHAALIEEPVYAVFASYLIRFHPRNKVYDRYLQYWLRSDEYWNLVHGHQTGSTRANLNAKVLGEFSVLVPDVEVAVSFGSYIKPIRDKILSNIRESESLASLRDTLLPKLISGELRVPDAEKFVEEAGL